MTTAQRQRIQFFCIAVLFVILSWIYGLFNRYNYVTAQIDLLRGKHSIVIIGLPKPCLEPCLELQEKYGFQQKLIGCLVTRPVINGVRHYNAVMERHLEKKNGADWRSQYQKELTAIEN